MPYSKQILPCTVQWHLASLTQLTYLSLGCYVPLSTYRAISSLPSLGYLNIYLSKETPDDIPNVPGLLLHQRLETLIIVGGDVNEFKPVSLVNA